MQFFENIGRGMIFVGLCGIVFILHYLLQKNHPLLNRVLGYCGVLIGIAIAIFLGKDVGHLSDDPAFKAGLIISIIGAAMLALGDTANRD